LEANTRGANALRGFCVLKRSLTLKKRRQWGWDGGGGGEHEPWTQGAVKKGRNCTGAMGPGRNGKKTHKKFLS